jgi:hypothetical protein
LPKWSDTKTVHPAALANSVNASDTICPSAEDCSSVYPAILFCGSMVIRTSGTPRAAAKAFAYATSAAAYSLNRGFGFLFTRIFGGAFFK